MNRSMRVLSAAAFTVLAGVARADAPYVNAQGVARCTRLDVRTQQSVAMPRATFDRYFANRGILIAP
ncbi:hypothetical protein B7G54_01620 [Burkholderia puraquae]|uniref:Uncharacterized protein n=1 Tax=Burkholderia puraquae TaxID=1904757 RepID=A0A1X1PNR6_9BURK|nr:hypothetical protein B7G54_01620 [Burkholderia puraquae]